MFYESTELTKIMNEKTHNIAIDPVFSCSSDKSSNYLFGIAEKDGNPGEFIPVSITQVNNYGNVISIPKNKLDKNIDIIFYITLVFTVTGMLAFGVLLWMAKSI
jgi:hypothetical protein